MPYFDQLQAHLENQWGTRAVSKTWHDGPIHQLPLGFTVLEFPPTSVRSLWTYATCGFSSPGSDAPIELHLFSPFPSDLHIELLTAICHFHHTAKTLGLNHTIDFGRPWLDDSLCRFGLVSLPYLDGPKLECFEPHGTTSVVRCLWLIPITEEERNYLQQFGLEALEQRFDHADVDYANPSRRSVV